MEIDEVTAEEPSDAAKCRPAKFAQVRLQEVLDVCKENKKSIPRKEAKRHENLESLRIKKIYDGKILKILRFKVQK